MSRRTGRRAEAWCALVLRLKGYGIVGRNLRLPGAEVDVLARRGRVLAVVEVKTRGTVGEAVAAVTRDKQRRLERAAGAWLARRPDHAGLDIRFDVMVVGRRPWPHHIPDAWRP